MGQCLVRGNGDKERFERRFEYTETWGDHCVYREDVTGGPRELLLDSGEWRRVPFPSYEEYLRRSKITKETVDAIVVESVEQAQKERERKLREPIPLFDATDFTLDRVEFERPEPIEATREEWEEVEREIVAERESKLHLFDPMPYTRPSIMTCGTPRLMEHEREARERLRRRRYPTAIV